MPATPDTQTRAEIEAIEHSRTRAAEAAPRRELLTESALALGFVVVAVVMASLGGGSGTHPGLAAWLTLICAVLVRVDFEVGEGVTHPLQLAFVPMLVLLSPGEIPLAVMAAHVLADLPEILRRRVPVQRLVVSVANSWFAIAPAVLVALAGAPAGPGGWAVLVAAATVVLIASDFAVSVLRMTVGLGMDPRAELRGFAWVYAADLALVPVGLLAGLTGTTDPVLVGAVLPLAALLAIFARERRGRIETALALHRLTEESRDRLQSIVRNSSDVIVILDADGTVRELTGATAAVFGEDWRAVQGRPLAERLHDDDVARLQAGLGRVTAKGPQEREEIEWRLREPDGGYRHVAAVMVNLLEDANVRGIVVTARDVDERKAFEDQLRHRAFHDGLTGLANRALFYDRVEHALSRGRRGASQVAVLFIDLDDFKGVNDRHGHALGDRLLQEASQRLTHALRAADTAARLGGDEFAVLLDAVEDPEIATATAQRVLDALAQPVLLGDAAVTLSASVGLALGDTGDRGVEELLRKADLAMYDAKRNGKRRVAAYQAGLEHLDVAGAERTAWFAREDEQRAEISDVLDDPDGVRMVFQPIVDLRTGRIAGYESLARFERGPRRGPDRWFAQAHRHGLGYALEAKAVAAALQTPGRPAGAYLTINLSPSSLMAEEVLAVLPERFENLVIEITENELVSEDPDFFAALAALRARGARLAVDDAGAGYAGLTHVMRLAPDVIKLDRALTTGVDADPVKAALIASFVRYARDIDATICAEGIETLEELRALADLDVAFGQGYRIARPGEPWQPIDPDAAAACAAAFRESLADGHQAPARAEHDRRLELLARRLGAVRSDADLARCLDSIAEELRADVVRLGPADAQVSVVLASDVRHADAIGELGFASRLAVPVPHAGATIATLEAYTTGERAWSRFEIGRARLLAHHIGPSLARIGGR